MELHWETNEALAHYVDDQERENARLKRRVIELEAPIIPQPLFVEPLPIVHSMGKSLVQARRFDRVTQLLYGIISFVTEGIKTGINLISKSFEVLENTHRMGIQIQNFRDILSVNLEHDEYIIVGHLAAFVASIESLKKEVRKRKGLPNVQRLR